MNESSATSALNKKLPKEVYCWKINTQLQKGVPDCYYSATLDMWVEYKYSRDFPARHTQLGLSSLQRKWLKGRHQQGRRVCVIFLIGSGGVVVDDPADWEKGRKFTRTELEAKYMSRQELACWILSEVADERSRADKRRPDNGNTAQVDLGTQEGRSGA